MLPLDLPVNRPANARSESVGFVPTRLGRLHVRSVGTGTPTVMWPSMFVDSHTWDALLPWLPPGRRYLLVDPPGLGLSEPLSARTDMRGAADAAVDLLEASGIAHPVDWVGNAFGGHVGYELAARPGLLRSLVAISAPAQAVPGPLRRQVTLLLPLLRWAGPVRPVRSGVVRGMLTQEAAACQPVRQVVEDSLRRPTRRSMALAVRSFILDRADVTATLPLLRVPSLFVASDDRGDWSPEDASAAAAHAPEAEAVTITGARTLVPLEQPEALAAHLSRFWSGLG